MSAYRVSKLRFLGCSTQTRQDIFRSSFQSGLQVFSNRIRRDNREGHRCRGRACSQARYDSAPIVSSMPVRCHHRCERRYRFGKGRNLPGDQFGQTLEAGNTEAEGGRIPRISSRPLQRTGRPEWSASAGFQRDRRLAATLWIDRCRDFMVFNSITIMSHHHYGKYGK